MSIQPVNNDTTKQRKPTMSPTRLPLKNPIKETFKKPRIELQTLPPEILLRIFSFLDVPFVVNTISLVCKLFYKLVIDDYTWKSRINSNVNISYPPITVSDCFHWRKACCLLEKEMELWRPDGNNMDQFRLKSAHYSFVHAVHLLQKGEICVSGSRDCSLKFWNLKKLKSPNMNMNTADVLIDIILNAHRGWIWSISSADHLLCTGGWDAMIHLWDLQDGCKRMFSSKCFAAVLCSSIHGNAVAAGTYSKTVNVLDMRRGMLPIFKYVAHSKPVLALQMDNDHIISASEDSTIVVYDRKAQKQLVQLRCPNYVTSLSYRDGFLIGGDRKGFVHLWDASDGKFEFSQTVDVGHDGSMTGLHHSMGCLITGCTDRSVRVSSPTNPSVTWATFEMNGDVGDLHYENGVLAVSSSDDIIIWKPKAST